MRIEERMEDRIEYFVNVEKRVVVAKLQGCENDAYEELLSKFGAPIVSILCSGGAGMMPDVFMARAKCAPGDEFDEALGKRIARLKVLKKWQRSKMKTTASIVAVLEKLIEDTKDHLAKVTTCYDNIAKKLDIISGKVDSE